jgi:ATP-dependent DNA helicase RecQ
MQGYEYIFVDEYQDIDEQQYSLVSALAGRRAGSTLTPSSASWRSVMTTRTSTASRACQRRVHPAVFRRTTKERHLPCRELPLDAEHHRGCQPCDPAWRRPDEGRPPDPDHARRTAEPPGGRWAALDAEQQRQGAPRDGASRPEPAGTGGLREIARIRRVTPMPLCGDIAVLARTHGRWRPLRALCEVEGVRYEVLTRDGAGAQLSADAVPGRLSDRRCLRASAIGTGVRGRTSAMAGTPEPGASEKTSTGKTSMRPSVEFADVVATQSSRRPNCWTPSTKRQGRPAQRSCVSAQADDGAWRQGAGVQARHRHGLRRLALDGEDERRLLYVAMTRARETL